MKPYSFRGYEFRKIVEIAAAILAALAFGGIARAQMVNIALSHVGNPKNAPDPLTGYGKVDYEYDIGTFDITEAQYTAFLNAVAQTDKYRLYTPKMAKAGNYKGSDESDDDFHTNAGIERSGDSGSYSYSVIGESGSDPVVYITWFDAARFCNWLHNGQPTGLGQAAGSTESGAYELHGDKTEGTELKNAGAKWWIPSEDEWYKAAYYDPTLNGGRGGYWLYPTRSNTAPGNLFDGGPNEANFVADGHFAVRTKPGDHHVALLTPVGAFRNSVSYYGTFDQGGDVVQWNDALINGEYRGLRGGCWNEFSAASKSDVRGYDKALTQDGHTGFRVAALPEEASAKK